ncbi:MAG TPA: 16S rRNA (cytidine(1402)-2'-O)-methyltransferase [Thermodesulfovibrionales bacterium]|nr:16S rRNA (cytidine(1402)-2'-O)-methyltransferase [Thermodesulfovibrionales bacterium]
MIGTLFIVSTPIGNLEDITLRALRVLKEADIIAAEDTRHSLKLLTHYGISKPMISYWREREQTRAEELIGKLLQGKSVALISDAGTPGIADPGTVLIRRALQENINVVPIPGATAFVAALSVSGISTEEVIFIGFLPSKKTQREKLLRELSLEKRTIVFYEAPHRIIETLSGMETLFIGRKAAVAKEITKMHEEVLRGSVSDILLRISELKIAGEYVVVIEGRRDEAIYPIKEAVAEVISLVKTGMGRKEAVRKISETYGLSKKELYDLSLAEEIA